MRSLLFACVFAQAPAVDSEITGRLASDDPVDVAWGAFLAASHGRKDLAPALVPRLAAAKGSDRLALERVLLDALVRLEGDVPADVLLAVHARQGADSCRTELLLAAARDPRRHADLLRAVLDHRETHGQDWWAAARLLASLRAPDAAKRLLPELEVRLDVTVDATDEDEGVTGGSAGAYGYVTRRPEAFPPAAEHRFVTGGVRGARAVLNGDLAFHLVRTETRRLHYAPPATKSSSRAPHALACLAFLAREDHPVPAVSSLVLRPDDDVDGAIALRVGELEAELRSLVSRLAATEMLDRESAEAFTPRVDVVLHGAPR